MADLGMSREFWRGKRVLVTGHTGFKGAWLCLWLKRLGAQVSGLSLAPESRPNLFDLAALPAKMDSRIGDVRDEALMRQVCEQMQPELVFHLAAQSLVRRSYTEPVATYSTNVMGTVNVLEASRQVSSVRSVVVVTSDKCYENREWVWSYRENEPMGGHDPYSSSKGCAELVTAAYRKSFFASGAGIASARAGNVIGGGDWAEDRLVPDCMRSLASGKKIAIRNPGSIRPWQHVLEPLAGYMLVARKLWEEPRNFAEGWNFGPEHADAQPVSWIADRVVSLWGGSAAWERVATSDGSPHEAHTLRLDSSLARGKLGWRPRLGLADALAWTVDWYKHHQQGGDMYTFTNAQIERYEAL